MSFGFEGVEQGLDDEALAEQDFVEPWHEIVLHGFADAGDELEAAGPELVEEGF